MPKVVPHQPTRDLMAANLKRLLEIRGETPQSLSRASGVPRSTIYKVQDADTATTVDVLGRLAAGLKVDVAEFFRKMKPVR